MCLSGVLVLPMLISVLCLCLIGPGGTVVSEILRNSVTVGEVESSKRVFRMGVMAPAERDYSISPLTLNSTLVALHMGIEKWLPQFLPQFYFNLTWQDTECDYKKNSMAAVVMYSDYKVNAFFGPMCTTLLSWTTTLALHYNMTAMTVGCHNIANIGKYVQLMSPFGYTSTENERIVDNNEPLPDFFYAINRTFHHFNWEFSTACIYLTDHSQNKRDDLYLSTLWAYVLRWKMKVKTGGVESFQIGLDHVEYPNGTVELKRLTEKQLNFITYTRVPVVAMRPELLRQFVYHVFFERGFNIEEYAVIYPDINYVTGDNDLNKPWWDPTEPENSEKNKILKHLFRNVLVFRMESSFGNETKKYERLKRDFVKACNESVFDNCDVPLNERHLQYVAAVSDGMLLLMKAMNETMKNNRNPLTNVVLPYVDNETFYDPSFAASSKIKFNSQGQRLSRMNLLAMEDVESGLFSTLVTFNFDGTNETKATKGASVPWVNSVMPRNPPDCGYMNEFCRKPDTLKYLVTFVSVGVSMFLTIILVVGFIVYRKVKMEDELMKMLWKIKSDELDFTEWKSSTTPAMDARDSSSEALSNSAGGGGQLYLKNLQNHNHAQSNVQNSHNHHAKLSVQAPSRKSSSVFGVRRISQHQGPLSSSSSKDKAALLSAANHYDNMVSPNSRPEPRYVFPRYKSVKVAARPLKDTVQFELNRKRLIELKNLKSLSHEHVVRFIGCVIDSQPKYIVYENCAKGSLYHFLRSPMKADLSFRFSLMLDIARGLNFLIQNGMFHGRLNAKTCVLDNRFVCKIGDHGLYALRPLPLLDMGRADLGSEDKYYVKYVYVAPEVLRRDTVPSAQDMQHTEFEHLMQRADYYSFAIISHEILYQKQPFHITNRDYSYKQKLQEIIKGGRSPFRPMFDDRDFTEELESYEKDVKELMTQRLANARHVMELCWAENAQERPEMAWVCNRLKENVPENIMENMLQRMDKYAKTMETLVEEKAKHVVLEKKRADDLLYSILPVAIANKLIRNEKVDSEWFDEATIYFSDIVGFTALSSSSTPEQVVDLLNHLYTLFDSIIDEFDVYKVETIGDAYMVVSGIPIRNGSTHSYNIAAMSLKLLEAVKNDFVIPHRPEEKLKLRIGLHTGPACAGVVGVKMPRYCLFGDTVNTASRMESNGEPLKIHISEQCMRSLLTFNEFLMEYRGEIEMKGKGLQKTYWLKGRKSTIVAKHPKLMGLIGNEMGPTARRSVCIPPVSSTIDLGSNDLARNLDESARNSASLQRLPKQPTIAPTCSSSKTSTPVGDKSNNSLLFLGDDSVFESPNTSTNGPNNKHKPNGGGTTGTTKGFFNANKVKLKRQQSSDNETVAITTSHEQRDELTPNGSDSGSQKTLSNQVATTSNC